MTVEEGTDEITCYELKPGDDLRNTTSQCISVTPSVSNYGTGGEGLDLDTGNKPPLDIMDQIIKEDQSNDGDSKE
jgi:hypothetical protein